MIGGGAQVASEDESKKRRRQRGEGGLYRRASDGLWIGVIDLGWRDGKRRRKVVSSKTQKGALKKLNDAKKKLADQGDISTTDVSLAAWLTYWLDRVVKPRADPETFVRYRTNVQNHIIPEIGRAKLEKLGLHHVRELHQRFIRLGLSESTAASAHRNLVTALNDAMKERGLGRNVAQLVGSPRIADSDPVALSMEDVRRFMTIAQRNPRTASRWLAAFMVGTRQGETLGLRWSSILWDQQAMDVSWQLQRLPYRHGCAERAPWTCGRKRASDCPGVELDVPRGFEAVQLYGRLCLTRPKSSRHLIPIPAHLRVALELRRAQADAERADYVSDHDLVWCRPDGEPIAHEDDYDEWVDWLAAAGIDHVKLHAARHTTATLLRALGYPMDIIRMILGHSTVLMTQRYTELDIRLAHEALDGFGNALALSPPVAVGPAD